MTTKSIVNKSKYSFPIARGLESHRILGYAHDDAEKGSARFRTFNRERLLHNTVPVIGEGSVKHAVYRGCDIAAGLILSALNSDAGAQDREILRAASLACYGWTEFTDPDRTATAMHPIIAALEGIERGELWVLRVDVRKSDQTGKVAVRAVLYDGEGRLPGNDFQPDYLPHVTMLVHLGPLLMPLVGAVNGRIGAN
jgi:hypothetical protein